MTKSQHLQFTKVHAILDRLSTTEPQKNITQYKNYINSALDEIGMLLMFVDNHPTIYDHPFWNDKLYDDIENGGLDLSQKIIATISSVHINGPWKISMRLTDKQFETSTQYIWYESPDHARSDIAELVKRGANLTIT